MCKVTPQRQHRRNTCGSQSNMRTCKQLAAILLIYSAPGVVESYHSCPQHLSEASDTKFLLQPKEITILGQIGTTATLPCKIPNKLYVNENTTATWTKTVDKGENITLAVNCTTSILDRRFLPVMTDLRNWTLLIRFAKLTDAGLYVCKISSNPPETLYINLNLTEAYADILGGDHKVVKAGSPLRLSCLLKNSREDPTYIFWYLQNRMINYDLEDGADVRFGRTGSELIIPRAEARHAGNYSCVPSNARQADVLVDVQDGEKAAETRRQGGSNSTGRYSGEIYDVILFILVFRLLR